jgi:hypothetical protein
VSLFLAAFPVRLVCGFGRVGWFVVGVPGLRRFSVPVWRVWLGRVAGFVGLVLLFLPLLFCLWCLVRAVLVGFGWLAPVRL